MLTSAQGLTDGIGRCASESTRNAGIPISSRRAALTIAALAFLVYANSLSNGFVWDDNIVIVANSALRNDAASLFSGIDAGRASELTPYYRPLTQLSFLVEERLWGLEPFPMHMLNILLHAANAFLVYVLARQLVDDNRGALLAGLLFAVHPINAESVNFLSGGRNTLLACLFALAAYLLHRKSVQTERVAFSIAGSVSLLAALLSKETALGILPFIAALELQAYGPADSAGRMRSAVRLLLIAVSAAVYFIVRRMAMSDAGVQIAIVPGLGGRLIDDLYIIPRYLLSLLWPYASSPQYVVPDDLHLLALPLLAAWLLIIVVAGWLLTKGKGPATMFGLMWIVVFFLPVSGVIAIPSAPLADRYLYLPAIGLWLVVADQAVRLLPTRDPVPRYGIAAAGAVLLILAAATVAANQQWKNDITLFSRYVERYPDRAFGHHNLGCAYLDKARDLDAAEREFRKAAALDPFFPRLWTQLGYISLLRGDLEYAVRHYTESIDQNPFDAEALLNRAIANENLGRSGEAYKDFSRFLALPGHELSDARPYAVSRMNVLKAGHR